jgi:hypothetical protein
MHSAGIDDFTHTPPYFAGGYRLGVATQAVGDGERGATIIENGREAEVWRSSGVEMDTTLGLGLSTPGGPRTCRCENGVAFGESAGANFWVVSHTSGFHGLVHRFSKPGRLSGKRMSDLPRKAGRHPEGTKFFGLGWVGFPPGLYGDPEGSVRLLPGQPAGIGNPGCESVGVPGISGGRRYSRAPGESPRSGVRAGVGRSLRGGDGYHPLSLGSRAPARSAGGLRGDLPLYDGRGR